MKKFTLLFAAVLPLFSLIAQNSAEEPLVIDIEKAVELAVQNNLTLKSSDLDVVISRRLKNTVWNSLVPTISVNADLRNTRELFFGTSPSHGTFLTPSLKFQLSLNASLGSAMNIAKINYETNLIKQETVRAQLERDVRKAFYGLITSRTNLELLQKNIDTAQKRYDQSMANYENGLIPELNVLRAQVTAENMKPGYHAAETHYRNSLMLFKLLLGVDRNREVEIQGSLDVTPQNYDSEELIQLHISSRLDIRSQNKALEFQKANKEVTFHMERTPTLILGTEWNTTITDPFSGGSWDTDQWLDTASFSLTLGIPLDGWIPGSKTSVKLKNAEDEIAKIQTSLEGLIRNAEIEIANLVMILNNSRMALETYGLNVALAQKAYDMTAEAYNLGTQEFLEVESAQNELFKAEQEVLTEKYNHLSALLDLAYAVNTPLDEIKKE